MTLTNFRKETSERSDVHNWAKDILKTNTEFYFESIEGCNQNANHLVTHLFERARVDYVLDGEQSIQQIAEQIIHLEGVDSLQRKINFAQRFGILLSYVLYCDENEKLFLFHFTSIDIIQLHKVFNNYKEFADWIAGIKGWRSHKPFRETTDLPHFDRRLRQEGTPWPTNIDCFICDHSNHPVAILEFQNADKVGVVYHCNNDYFLCKMTGTDQWGRTTYHDDIRRWTSQEIIRVQSSLRFFIISWATTENDFTLKEVDKITIPYFQKLSNGQMDWAHQNQYKAALNRFSNTRPRNVEFAHIIANTYMTFNLSYKNSVMTETVNTPPLHTKNQTFPYIYYRFKQTIKGNRIQLAELFTKLIT